ncbi:phosphodiester glycosidase family protein [Haematobacter missouriensis]|nr:phosphodiester glycosidase family protein [Haematobacter missouriensis]
MTGRFEGPFAPVLLFFAALMSLVPVAAPAAASPCERMTFGGEGYVLCSVPKGADMRVWHRDAAGSLYGSFRRIDNDLRTEGRRLGFAMNGGMYHANRDPVGLLVTDGVEHNAIVTGASKGNFGMLPNGIFCIGDGGYAVIESRAFARHPLPCRFATQSGPMLVIEGELHPRFLPDSDSRFIRNGVGVRQDGTAVFAISDRPVTFYEFGRLFRDGLKTPNALYLDGKISRLYAPALRRNDFGFPMGPIVGLAVPENAAD